MPIEFLFIKLTNSSSLTNAVTSLTSHLTNQTRHLTVLLQPHVSPLSIPSPEMISDLHPLITDLIISLPPPPTTPLPAIHALTTTSAELQTSLAILSDSLHMTRQTTSLAARRLRSAREVVETLRREMREAEEGLQWLEAGSWEKKLRNREAASVCDEVVGGFEEVCERWRRRIGGEGAVAG
jgi:hypothetical protein